MSARDTMTAELKRLLQAAGVEVQKISKVFLRERRHYQDISILELTISAREELRPGHTMMTLTARTAAVSGSGPGHRADPAMRLATAPA